jgi:hypothetical protein
MDKCQHEANNWDLHYVCQGCGELVPEEMGDKRDDAQGERIKVFIKEIHQLYEKLNAWEEKEAACCPEDFGFDEYIRMLEKRLAALQGDTNE